MAQIRDASGRFTNPFKNMRGSKRDVVKSYDWYVKQVKALGASRMRPSGILKSEIGEFATRLNVGEMYLFMYDPKLKETLPVYDTFPLVFPFQKTDDGFIGINLHYLPYMMRAQLLSRLYELANTDTMSPRMKLRLSWAVLDDASRYPGVRVCVKRYLASHIRSRMLRINTVDWKATIFLPIENFQKMTKDEVFRQSRRSVTNV